jgi:hypothetical protein
LAKTAFKEKRRVETTAKAAAQHTSQPAQQRRLPAIFRFFYLPLNFLLAPARSNVLESSWNSIVVPETPQ